ALGPPRRSPGGIPIGFDDDAAYLASYEQWLVRRLLVAPPGVRLLSDLDNFRYATLLCLLRADDLTLISIWNPTFLTALLERLPAWSDRLVRDLADGRFRPPEPLAPLLAASTVPDVPGQPRRAELLASLLNHQPADSPAYDCLWPRLQLISCWTDAAARPAAEQLARLFPGVEFQGKGLLATECCVSFPLTAPAAPVLALQSAFFEFLPCNPDGQAAADAGCRLAQQLEAGGRYQVIVTTGGGLYRYQLHDQVQVLGHYRDCPLLRFVGKADCTSDLVGEKLSEPQVRQAMEDVADQLGLRLEFALLVPIREPRDHYRLYLQTGGEPLSASQAGRLAAQLQTRLEENPHYRYACGLQQLDPLEVWWLAHSERSARDLYQRGCLARGQRLGDIKPLALDTRTGWPDILADCGEWRRASSRKE
ncbi:MAG: GH3 auxin-responsive promoter family protein, partial [Pirellulaceae bacterium]|nr:GH3 auxin-responsive promoter family protein [Pirellulaceae bacterium]